MRLIDDLFTLSRAEVKALALDLQPIALGAVVQRRLDALTPLAWEREHIELVAEMPEDLPLVHADEGRLDQILVWRCVKEWYNRQVGAAAHAERYAATRAHPRSIEPQWL
jgi:hypothetical protein